MKILLSDTWAGGGGSTFVATLSRGLVQRGHIVDVILGYRTSSAVNDYSAIVRKVHTPPSNFRSIMVSERYDILHVTDGDLSVPFDYARRSKRLGAGARVVATVHSAFPTTIIPTGIDVLVFVSDHSRSGSKIDGEVSAATIHNGVDPTVVSALANQPSLPQYAPPIAIWIGRVEETTRQKDFLGFAYSVPSFLAAGWTVVIFDGSPAHNDYPIQEQLARWFPRGVVYFNQASNSTVLGVMKQASDLGGAVISTARTEAFPFVVLEALALKCPVVLPSQPAFLPFLERGVASTYHSFDELVALAVGGPPVPTSKPFPNDWTAESMVASYVRLYERELDRPMRDKILRMRAIEGATRIEQSPLGRLITGARTTLRYRGRKG